MNLFFDIDGTLIDSSERIYRLFSDISKLPISFNEYWEIKRKKISNFEILQERGFAKNQISYFNQQWMEKIESDDYLSFDKIFLYTIPSIKFCKQRGHKIYFVTQRQDKKRLERELQEKKILDYCDACFVTEMKYSKSDMISNSNIKISTNDLWIGDSEDDIKSAKFFNMQSIVVLSGVRNKEVLLKYEPDTIINDVSEIKLFI